ncbi:hypothetical protein roselon_02400 [Roseibacterium elongatum DSM 19469]|uniref:Uncharacterized protein n=1 Tax=Roseicyclus elongatus DSM 19469 TaxID=1294273 RepID=W8S3D8_9RHOB|nr:hypothetical protein roselon_02400 [Roseibacterium elongatum DSM 19469]
MRQSRGQTAESRRRCGRDTSGGACHLATPRVYARNLRLI